MKKENTIKQQKNKLRQFILDNNDSSDPKIKSLVDQAYGMECALMWVTEKCSWNPIGSCRDSLKYYKEKQNV